MTEAIPGHSPLDSVRPELRDLARAALGRINPESALGKNLIARVYEFELNFYSAHRTMEEQKALANEAAAFNEQAYRLPLTEAELPDFSRIGYKMDAIRLYKRAGNLEKARALLAEIT